MKDRIKVLLNKETLSYLFFGVLTTVVNYTTFIGAFLLCNGKNPLISNVIAFITATAFAYITNKIWVFNSRVWNLMVLKSEITSFLGARILSFAFEQICLLICISVLNVENYLFFGLNGIMISKVILSFIVVIMNYGLSKFFIFKEKSEG